MARFSEYLDASYLPGEVYTAGLSEYRSRPQDIIDHLSRKKLKADPDYRWAAEDGGDYFQRFLALQNNPEALVQGKVKLPQRFQEFMAMSGLGT